MKRKIIGIIICTLLISSTGSIVLTSIFEDSNVSGMFSAQKGLKYHKIFGGLGFDDGRCIRQTH